MHLLLHSHKYMEKRIFFLGRMVKVRICRYVVHCTVGYFQNKVTVPSRIQGHHVVSIHVLYIIVPFLFVLSFLFISSSFTPLSLLFILPFPLISTLRFGNKQSPHNYNLRWGLRIFAIVKKKKEKKNITVTRIFCLIHQKS